MGLVGSAEAVGRGSISVTFARMNISQKRMQETMKLPEHYEKWLKEKGLVE